MAKNYYAILGVRTTASPSEIKKAFRKLAATYHPDKGGDAEKFKEVNEANSVLSDPVKRQQYDNPTPNFGGMGTSYEDLMRGFRDHDPRFTPFSRQGKSVDRPAKGQDIKLVMEVSLAQFIFGAEITATISYEEACKVCNGKGYTESKTCDVCNGAGRRVKIMAGQGIYTQAVTPCDKCRGTGEVSIKDCDNCNGSGHVRVGDKKFNVPVIRGARDGQVVTLRGKGRVGVHGGPNGDVHVKLQMNLPDPDSLSRKQRKVLESL